MTYGAFMQATGQKHSPELFVIWLYISFREKEKTNG